MKNSNQQITPNQTDFCLKYGLLKNRNSRDQKDSSSEAHTDNTTLLLFISDSSTPKLLCYNRVNYYKTDQ